MIAVSKVISAVMNGYRTIKVLCFGKSDVRTPLECAPYGYDGNPIKDTKAMYAQTTTNGQDVIIGYNNTGQLSQPGESRMYATDSTGAFKCNIWFRANGDILIGDSNSPSTYTEFFVKHTALNTSIQAMLVTVNSNFTALYALLGTPAPPVTINIAPAKTTKIKTI